MELSLFGDIKYLLLIKSQMLIQAPQIGRHRGLALI